MEDLSERHTKYVNQLEKFNQVVKVNNVRAPKDIIAEGVRMSTSIKDEKTVDTLADKAMRAEAYVKENNYDVFLFGIAEALENVRCETSSMHEYFTWIDDAKKIMDHMTDGNVSEKDWSERQFFIEDSWQREAEILTCLGLYEKSNNPLAKEKKQILMLKLQRLRQIRSALMNFANGKKSNVKAERYQAAVCAKTLNGLKNIDDDDDDDNEEILQNLQLMGIDHFGDFEFYDGYSFYTRMLEEQRRFDMEKENVKELEILRRYSGRPDECLTMLRHKDDTNETIRERIARLSGIKSNMNKNYSLSDGSKHKRFASQEFNYLREQRERILEQV